MRLIALVEESKPPCQKRIRDQLPAAVPLEEFVRAHAAVAPEHEEKQQRDTQRKNQNHECRVAAEPKMCRIILMQGVVPERIIHAFDGVVRVQPAGLVVREFVARAQHREDRLARGGV